MMRPQARTTAVKGTPKAAASVGRVGAAPASKSVASTGAPSKAGPKVSSAEAKAKEAELQKLKDDVRSVCT